VPAPVIVGVVVSGRGGASRAMADPERMASRREVSGMPLVPGTLNVLVADLGGAVESLGVPARTSEAAQSGTLGPLQWWPVLLEAPAGTFVCWVVRHVNTGTRYLELVADVRFRDLGVRDGVRVEVTPL
jgi:CTP-dependent riboflavin kinase